MTPELLDFQRALAGKRGDLDAWLEVNSDSEIRAAVQAAIDEAVAKEREACACHAKAYMVERYGNTYGIADAIRSRSKP